MACILVSFRNYIHVQILQRHCLDGINVQARVRIHDGEAARDKEFLWALGREDFEYAGVELSDSGHMRSQNTHVTVCGREIDLGGRKAFQECLF